MVRLPDGMAQSSASILVLGQSLGLSAAQHFYVPLHTYACTSTATFFNCSCFHILFYNTLLFSCFFCVFHFCTISVFQFTFSPLLRSIFIHLCMFTSALLYVFFLLAQATINLLQLTVFYSLSTPLTIFRLLKAEAVKA